MGAAISGNDFTLFVGQVMVLSVGVLMSHTPIRGNRFNHGVRLRLMARAIERPGLGARKE